MQESVLSRDEDEVKREREKERKEKDEDNVMKCMESFLCAKLDREVLMCESFRGATRDVARV